MINQAAPDIIIYICKNCIPAGRDLPIQWMETGMQVCVKEVPCSGKIDTQYLFHALEGGVQGISIIACDRGECTFAQGNYRAEIRIKTVKRLLKEIGLDSRSVELIYCRKNESLASLKELISDATQRLQGLALSPRTTFAGLAGAKTGSPSGK